MQMLMVIIFFRHLIIVIFAVPLYGLWIYIELVRKRTTYTVTFMKLLEQMLSIKPKIEKAFLNIAIIFDLMWIAVPLKINTKYI